MEGPFDAARLRGVKLTEDLVDAKTGKTVAEAGNKMTPRKLKKLEEEGLKDILIAEEQIMGGYLAIDLFDESTGEIIAEAGDEVDEKVLDLVEQRSIEGIAIIVNWPRQY